MMDILTYRFGGNLVRDYLMALVIFGVVIGVIRVFKELIIARLRKITAKTKTDFDDLVIKIVAGLGWPLYLWLSLYLALQFIHPTDLIQKVMRWGVVIIFTFYAVKAIQTMIDYATRKAIEKRRKEEKVSDTAVIDLLSKLLKATLWVVALILVLSNLGYNISTLIAGLGIGGVAIAFALQNILGDIFAAFSIYFDKPFQIGDFIIVGGDLGVVKKIGIKTTRIQTLQGEELVVSNRELTETRVHNYKKMERRRIAFGFGVIYETPTEKLRKIPQIIKEIVTKVKLADIDRVHFKRFGDFSLDFEVVYYLNTNDYNKYMDTQQEINLAIKERFEKEGIEMAYPTQTLYVNRGNEPDQPLKLSTEH